MFENILTKKELTFKDLEEIAYKIACKFANEILYNIIEEYKLDFEKIIKYVRETNSKNVLNKLLILAR